MSWGAIAGGVFVGPFAGALASSFVRDRVKPTELSTKLLISSATQAVVALGAYTLSDSLRKANAPNVSDFAYGATWGNGIAAGILGMSGAYAQTEGGKEALLKGRFRPLAMMVSGEEDAEPDGLLGLLSAAKHQGY